MSVLSRNLRSFVFCLSIGSLLLFAGCQQAPEQPTAELPEFLQLCEQLPVLSLPYELSCEECCVSPTTSRYEQQLAPYLPEGASFFAILDIQDTYISILVTYPADRVIPAVCTFTPEGERIAEQAFMGGFCGEDYELVRAQHLLIPSTTEIRETDTTVEVMMEPATYEILDTLHMEIEHHVFRIDVQGTITHTSKV